MNYIELELPKEHAIANFAYKILKHYVNDQRSDFWNIQEIYHKTHPEMFEISQMANKILQDNGFHTKSDINNSSDVAIEFHYAHSSSIDKEIKPTFDLHTDNYGPLSCDVNTFICYLENTAEEGGELGIFYGYDLFSDIDIKLDTKPSTTHLKVKLFPGNLYHCAIPIKNGVRVALSFIIRKE